MNFKSIYEENKNLVFNLALQYVQNIEDAEEISQDVFIKVYQKMDSFHGKSKISTWIYRITINQSLDYIKAKKRKKRAGIMTSLFFDNEEEKNHPYSEFKHPGVLLEEKEELEKLFKCINQLPENQKTALILLKIEQKPQKEVAEIMDIGEKALESLFSRAKKKLKKIIILNEGK